MARTSSLLVLAALASGCDRPHPLVICHNANCAEPTDPEDDDTIPALEQSLALTVDGLPAIDGTEVDSFWRASDSTCLFAHDLDAPRTTPITDAADSIAAYIMAGGQLTHTPGQPFRVFFELKAHVGVEKSERHTPEQRVLHAQCAWGAYTTIANAAVAAGANVEFVFASFNPDLLREVINQTPASTPIVYKFDAFYGIPHPLDSETRPLSDYHDLPISIVELHNQWLYDSQWEGLLSYDGKIETLFWMFSATEETFQAIEQYEPDMVDTSEARLMRRWLEH